MQRKQDIEHKEIGRVQRRNRNNFLETAKTKPKNKESSNGNKAKFARRKQAVKSKNNKTYRIQAKPLSVTTPNITKPTSTQTTSSVNPETPLIFIPNKSLREERLRKEREEKKEQQEKAKSSIEAVKKTPVINSELTTAANINTVQSNPVSFNVIPGQIEGNSLFNTPFVLFNQNKVRQFQSKPVDRITQFLLEENNDLFENNDIITHLRSQKI